MTTFEEIIKRAEGLGLPIARNQFTATNKKPVPDPPFLVYLSTERQRGDDTKNRIREIEGSLELYTERKADPDLEKQIRICFSRSKKRFCSTLSFGSIKHRYHRKTQHRRPTTSRSHRKNERRTKHGKNNSWKR